MRSHLSLSVAVLGLIAGMLLGPAVSTQAQETEPMVCVSLASAGEVLADANAVVEVLEIPMLAMPLAMAGPAIAQSGIRQDEPIGVLLSAEEGDDEPSLLAFLPIDSPDKLFAMLVQFGVIEAAPEADAEGVYEIEESTETTDLGDGASFTSTREAVFLLSKGGWLFVATTREDVLAAPDDPVALLGDMPAQHTVAVRIKPGLIPESMKSQAGMMGGGMGGGMGGDFGSDDFGPDDFGPDDFGDDASEAPETEDSEGDFGFETPEGLDSEEFEGFGPGGPVGASEVPFLKSLEAYEEFEVGLKVDPATKSLIADFIGTPKTDSELAEWFAEAPSTTTRFGAIFDATAPEAFRLTGKLTKDQIETMVETVDEVRQNTLAGLAEQEDLTDEQREVAEGVFGDIFDVLEETVRSGSYDAGVTVRGEESQAQVLAGLAVSDGAKIDAALRRLVAQLTQDDPKAAKMVKLDAGTVDGLKLHQGILPAKLFKDWPLPIATNGWTPLVVGIDAERFYIALGPGSSRLLVSTIKASASSADEVVLPGQGILASLQTIKMAMASEKDPDTLAEMTEMLGPLVESLSPEDHIAVTQEASDGTMTTSVEVSQGMIKGIGQMVTAAMAAFRQGFSEMEMEMMETEGGSATDPSDGMGGNGFSTESFNSEGSSTLPLPDDEDAPPKNGHQHDDESDPFGDGQPDADDDPFSSKEPEAGSAIS